MAVRRSGQLTSASVTNDLEFSAESTKDFDVVIGLTAGNIVRARAYVATDPGGAFSQGAQLSFFTQARRLAEDEIFRNAATEKLVYTELSAEAAAAQKDVQVDDESDFAASDLFRILDGASSEFGRVVTVAVPMVAQDNLQATHAIDSGVVRCLEIGGYTVPDEDTAGKIYGRLTLESSQTVDITVTVEVVG